MKQTLKFVAAAVVLGAGLLTAATVTPAGAVDMQANYFSDAQPAATAVVVADAQDVKEWEFTARNRPLKCRTGG